MRISFIAIFITASLFSCNGEEKKSTLNETPAKIDSPVKVLPPVTHYTVPDHSPMDMIYFPNEYPLLKMADKISVPPLMRIIYSRPQKEKRQIFNGLVKYDVPWRLGANEATEIEFFSPATVQGKAVKAGRYILYCIPQETKWIFVLNSNLYSWGLQQNRKKDIMQFEAHVTKNDASIEYFTIASEKQSDKTTILVFLWDDVKVKLPVSF